MNERAFKDEDITDVAVVENNNQVDRIDTDTVLHNIKAQGEIFDALQAYVKSHMIEDQDFGTIPGCAKPSLWKPGAEKINFMFNLVPKYEILKETESNTEYTYKIRSDLYNKNNGKFMGSGLGYASSREKKFASAPANTILKMCKKRAYIDATLSSTMASFIFTQDVIEDDDTEVDKKDKQKQFGTKPAATVTQQSDYSLDPETYKLSGGKHVGIRMIDCPSNYIEWNIQQAKTSKFKQTFEKVPMDIWIEFLEVCLKKHKANKELKAKPVTDKDLEPEIEGLESEFANIEEATTDDMEKLLLDTFLGAKETEHSKATKHIKGVLK